MGLICYFLGHSDLVADGTVEGAISIFSTRFIQIMQQFTMLTRCNIEFASRQSLGSFICIVLAGINKESITLTGSAVQCLNMQLQMQTEPQSKNYNNTCSLRNVLIKCVYCKILQN